MSDLTTRILDALSRPSYTPVKPKVLAKRLGVAADTYPEFRRTLRELVDFSRPATKDRRLCDMHEIIDKALSIAKYYKRRKGKRIVTRYADDFPKFRAVHDQLVQVFLNLVLNALDATNEGGTIEITTELKNGWIQVAVHDDGPGMMMLVNLLSAALSNSATQNKVAPGLVGSSNDLKDLIRWHVQGRPESSRPPLASGWRLEVCGETLLDVLGGKRALRVVDPQAEAERSRTESTPIVKYSYRQPFGTFTGNLPGGLELSSGFGVMEHHDANW